MINPADVIVEATNRGFTPNYVIRAGQSITRLLCKKCGKMIANRSIVDGAWTLRYLPLYTELTIECDDGSNHVTNCCGQCAGGLTKEDLDLFLAIDAVDMMVDVQGTAKDYFKAMGARKVKE